MWIRVCCFTLTVILIVGDTSGVEVTLPTSLGVLRGVQDTTYSGLEYHRFSGVKYSKKPDRFKECKVNNEISGGLEECPPCPQLNPGPLSVPKPFGSEDCLCLNIYKPANISGKAGVIVFIHGGGWLYGSGSKQDYGPDYLIEEGIIFVTLQYRINVLGFSYFNSDEFSSNAGLKDTVCALKFLGGLINDLGGDKEKVTLAGWSAGAAIAQILSKSKHSKGLFGSMILISGSSFAPWAVGSRDRIRDSTIRLGMATGICSGEALKYRLSPRLGSDLAVCLSQLSPERLQKASSSLKYPMPFTPIVESASDKSVITCFPWVDKSVSDSLPTILGTVKGETFSGIPAYELFKIQFSWLIFRFGYQVTMPKIYLYDRTSSNPKLVTDKICSQYPCYTSKFNNKIYFEIGDAWYFLYPEKNSMKSMVLNNTWAYFNKLNLKSPTEKYVGHGGDLGLYFPTNMLNIRLSGKPQLQTVSRTLTMYWATFVNKRSLSGTKWEAYSEKSNVLIINSKLDPTTKTVPDPNKGISTFWDKLTLIRDRAKTCNLV